MVLPSHHPTTNHHHQPHHRHYSRRSSLARVVCQRLLVFLRKGSRGIRFLALFCVSACLFNFFYLAQQQRLQSDVFLAFSEPQALLDIPLQQRKQHKKGVKKKKNKNKADPAVVEAILAREKEKIAEAQQQKQRKLNETPNHGNSNYNAKQKKTMKYQWETTARGALFALNNQDLSTATTQQQLKGKGSTGRQTEPLRVKFYSAGKHKKNQMGPRNADTNANTDAVRAQLAEKYHRRQQQLNRNGNTKKRKPGFFKTGGGGTTTGTGTIVGGGASTANRRPGAFLTRFDEDPLAPLHYAPQRIPGYINLWGQDTLSLYGFVMRDLTTRICSRQITSSTILVVSPEAPSVAHYLQTNQTEANQVSEAELQRQFHYAVGGSTLIKVHKEGHVYHGLNHTDTTTTTTLDSWWNSFEDNGNTTINNTSGLNGSRGSKPTWIMLAMIDHGPDNDDIIQNAMTLLKESTVTYIVLGIGVDPNGGIYGYQAIQKLMSLKYKVQLLSLSHMSSRWYHTVSHLYRPNADLNQKTVSQFFAGLQEEAGRTGTPVLGYIFATQGLDLAIPTATEYRPTLSEQHHSILYNKCPETGLSVKIAKKDGLLDLHIDCNGQTIQPANASNIWMTGTNILTSEAVCVRATCAEQPHQAACTTRIIPQVRPTDEKQQQATLDNRTTQQQQEEQGRQPEKPNLLVVMLDPISRQRFQRSLVKTNRLIKMLNFTSFSQYTAVGNNSGPNQAALYSGVPLQSRDSIAGTQRQKQRRQWLWDTLKDHGYATFKAEDGCVENSNMIQSIKPKVDHGDALQRMMCYDFQRPNCVGETPAADYLFNYGRQFIQGYSRANNTRPWAAMLHFIDSHEDTMTLEGTLDDKLWRFLYSIYNTDSNSSGQGMCRTANTKTAKATRKQQMPCGMWDNTLIVLISDHGLHYGSYLTTPKGLQERSQPMLHLHLPTSMSASSVNALEENRDKWATPFDLYETIVDALVPESKSSSLSSSSSSQIATGSTLLEPLSENRTDCYTTNGIPQYICDILHPERSTIGIAKDFMMPNPPSVMSFYADIPHVNKQVPRSCPMYSNKTLSNPYGRCVCATNLRPWHACTKQQTAGETFSMVDCGKDRSYTVNVTPDPTILERPEVSKALSSGAAQQRPNVLILELDSVSQAYADRHFPRTRELLSSLRMRKTGYGEYSCGANETLCSADFSQFSVVGASSIPNQVAALGGCIVTTGPERCDKLEFDSLNRTICTDDSHLVFGMQLVSEHSFSWTFCRVDEQGRSPWMFDIAKSAGYVTLFAEEFCYDGSVYVSQGNIFDLDADILPHKFFCRNVERRAAKEGIKINGPIWQYEDSSNPTKPCVDDAGSYTKQKVAIDHISTMWDAYSNIPKFAFVNAMAAHVYGEFKTMASAAEAYDITISKFLSDMFARSDAENTIIVVRADHGLQAGPQTPDYSIQTEAFRPWTEIIVPKSFPELSLDNLFHNQKRLANGYDLYRTLSSSLVGKETSLMPTYSPWMHHLWKDNIPQERSCADAKILPSYCIYESTRTITSPNLKTCNMVEPAQRLICPLYNETFHEVFGTNVDNAFITRRIQSEVCPARTTTNISTINTSLKEEWDALHQNIANNGDGNPVSGGMYLYPRQAAIISGVVKELSQELYKAEGRHLNICETGFGAGHSAAMFLESSPYTNVHSFDYFGRTYQQPAVDQLREKYGNGRLSTYVGNTCETLGRTLWPIARNESDVQCDFLHGSSLCRTDNIDLVKRSPCGVILTSTAMRTLRDLSVYFGSSKAQWAQLRQQGCIRDVKCFEEEPTKQHLGFATKANTTAVSSKFCLGVTTGTCQEFGRLKKGLSNGECETKIAEITERIQMNYLCPAHETPIPAIQATSKKRAKRKTKRTTVVNKNWAKQISTPKK